MVEEHVRGCAECEKLLEEYAKLDQLVAEHGQLADSDYWEKAAQKIDRAIAAGGQTEIDHTLTHRRRSGLSWKLLAAAASVVIVGYIGINKDKFLTPDKQVPMIAAPSVPTSRDSEDYRKSQAESDQRQTQPNVKAKQDAGGATGKTENLPEEASGEIEKSNAAPRKELASKPAQKESTAPITKDLKGEVKDELAVPQSIDLGNSFQKSQPAPAPAMSALTSDSAESLKLRRASNEAAILDAQSPPPDTGLGLAHWTALRDSLLPLADAEHKAKNVLELGKTVISGYDKAARKPSRLAATTEPSPDSRLAEACYWIAKLSKQPEEKSQAIATLRQIGERANDSLKATVQNWIKELAAP